MVFVVAYALGYRFDLNSKKILQTTALAIETTPDNAVVLLNGQPATDPTPFISTLSPGQYAVAVQKNGYHSWKKQLQFEQGKSLIFPNVVLFKQGEPTPRDPLPSDPAAEYTPLTTVNKEMELLYRTQRWLGEDILRIITGPWDVVVDTSTRTSYIVEDSTRFSSALSYTAVFIDAEWMRDTTAVFASDFELLLFSPVLQTDQMQNRLNVIHRQSNRLLDVEWHPDGGYIFFSDASGLYALELDERDHRQLWQLSTLPSPTQLQVNTRGDELSFISNRQWYDLLLYD